MCIPQLREENNANLTEPDYTMSFEKEGACMNE